jgi:hypothetical protein
MVELLAIYLNYGDITNRYFHMPLTLYSINPTVVVLLSVISCFNTYTPVFTKLIEAPVPDNMKIPFCPELYIAEAPLYNKLVKGNGKSIAGTVTLPTPLTFFPPQNSARPLFHLR